MKPTLTALSLLLLTLTACPPTEGDDTGPVAPFCNDVDSEGEPGHPARVFYLNDDGDDYGNDEVRLCHDPFENRPDNYSPFAGDCDDDNNAIHPDAAEVCDGIDNDCDGDVDGNALDATQWYVDDDGDGYGYDIGPAMCSQPPGHVDNGNDCDDSNGLIYPGVQGCE